MPGRGRASFLAAAERLGVIGEINRWVVERGIELAAWGLRVEINLSARSVGDERMLEVIRRQIERTAADPNDVIFEITETAAIASMDEDVRFASELKAIGCLFALDDFGTGFGSFAYLKHLPVAILKIDGEFIRGLASEGERVDHHIIQAIVLVARALGVADRGRAGRRRAQPRDPARARRRPGPGEPDRKARAGRGDHTAVAAGRSGAAAERLLPRRPAKERVRPTKCAGRGAGRGASARR